MRNDLIPEGATLLAVSLLSRGDMTRPRALVAYRRHLDDDSFSGVVHEAILDDFPAHRTHGSYLEGSTRDAADAATLKAFEERLDHDHHCYGSRGTSLTEPDWLNVRSWIEVLEAREEGRVMTPGVDGEELLERHKKATGIYPPKGWDEVPGGPEDLTDRPSASDLDMGRAIR